MSDTAEHPGRRVSSYDRDAPTPAVGSRWIWERGSPHAEETITVSSVKWNGEEWWVEVVVGRRATRSPSYGVVPGNPYWNDLSRFWEAVSPAGAWAHPAFA
jgi:hypothetical protein